MLKFENPPPSSSSSPGPRPRLRQRHHFFIASLCSFSMHFFLFTSSIPTRRSLAIWDTFECWSPHGDGAPRPDGLLEQPIDGLLARRGRGVMPRGGGGGNHGRGGEERRAAPVDVVDACCYSRQASSLDVAWCSHYCARSCCVARAVRRGSNAITNMASGDDDDDDDARCAARRARPPEVE